MDEIETLVDAMSAGSRYVRVALILAVGLILSRIVKRLVRAQTLRSQQLVLMRRFASTVILVISIAWALAELGFNLGYVLGAAGVLTIAVGFAAQTSVSNLISGLFLMSERPFVIGDVIQIAERTGEVTAIDLLSVKLRTFDNLLVRIPNEAMLKSNVVNLSHYPIRRLDIPVGVAYDQDLDRVTKVLMAVADRMPIALTEPEPQVVFQKFGESSVDIQYSVWASRENFVKLRRELPKQIHQAFEREGIEIPFPHRVVRIAAEDVAKLAAARS